MTSPLANQVLASLQKGRFRKTGAPLPIQDPDVRRDSFRTFLQDNRADLSVAAKLEALEGYHELALKQAAILPSKYEDPIVYGDLQEIGDAVAEASRECGYPDLRDSVLLGTLDSGRLTATTYYLAATGEYVLTVNLRLWTVARQVAWAITQAAQLLVRDDFPEDSVTGASVQFRLAVEPSIQVRFRRLLQEWVTGGMAYPHAMIYDEPDKQFGTALQRSMKAFTVAHEYGHIVSGHYQVDFEELAAKVPMVAMAGRGVLETRADAIALEILQQMHSSNPTTTLPWAGAAAYFVSSDIFSRVVGIMKYGDEEVAELSKTHPQPAERRSELFGEIEELDRPVREAMAVEVALRLLWNQTRPEIERLRAANAAIAPVWQSEAPTGGRVSA
jgi:hypothetical protein